MAAASFDYSATLADAVADALFANEHLADVAINNRLPAARADRGTRKAHARAPGDFAQVAIDLGDDVIEKTSTPTLGQGRVAGAPAIHPVRVVLLVTYTYDAKRWAQLHPTAKAPEVEGRAALMSQSPRIGNFSWVGGFRIERARGGVGAIQVPPPESAADTVVTDRITFDLKLQLAQLASA